MQLRLLYFCSVLLACQVFYTSYDGDHHLTYPKPLAAWLPRSSRPAFHISSDPRVLGETDATLDVANHPLSPYRPQNQFASDPHAFGSPVIVLATIAANLSQEAIQALSDTSRSLAQSSLQSWEWYILVPTNESDALDHLAEGDGRVQVHGIDMTDESKAYNLALQMFKDLDASAASFLPLGALVEPTWLEKAAWSLHAVPEWDLIGAFDVLVDLSNPNRSRVDSSGLVAGDRLLTVRSISRGISLLIGFNRLIPTRPVLHFESTH
jgi:hypothetical protein